MANKQIAARISGDDYQARFFWFIASQLLVEGSGVVRVLLEYDKATHIDDVAVFYQKSSKSDWGIKNDAEFYQVKYHVDNRVAYTADAMIDPAIINSKESSLLIRFFQAYRNLKNEYSCFTLNLVSNWIWGGDDKLARYIRDGGALPDKFFTLSPRTDLGKIRVEWMNHVRADEDTFTDFAKRLRFKLNYFSNPDLNKALSDRLYRAGLIPLDEFSYYSPYDDLVRKFIERGVISFNKEELFKICQEAKLIYGPPPVRDLRTIGIRSYMRFAENMGLETDDFVCVADYFDGRFPKDETSWTQAANTVRKFIIDQQPQLSRVDHKILLDCHTSLAFLAGYLMTHRARVYPAGPRSGIELSKPSKKPYITDRPLWKVYQEIFLEGAPSLAVVVSVANKVDQQVREFLHHAEKYVGSLLILEPCTGTGGTCIVDANQGWAMATELVQTLRKFQNGRGSTLMFISAPNFFTFFIGQLSRSLRGKLTIFEYGMDDPESGTYSESITIPFPHI